MTFVLEREEASYRKPKHRMAAWIHWTRVSRSRKKLAVDTGSRNVVLGLDCHHFQITASAPMRGLTSWLCSCRRGWYVSHLTEVSNFFGGGGGTWCLERFKAGEQGDRGWDGWMASSTQWTWVWANSRRVWRMGKPGVLQPMGLQRTGHDWETEQ